MRDSAHSLTTEPRSSVSRPLTVIINASCTSQPSSLKTKNAHPISFTIPNYVADLTTILTTNRSFISTQIFSLYQHLSVPQNHIEPPYHVALLYIHPKLRIFHATNILVGPQFDSSVASQLKMTALRFSTTVFDHGLYSSTFLQNSINSFMVPMLRSPIFSK